MSIDQELINFADDQDDDPDEKGGMERFSEAVLYGTDWTVRSLLHQIENGNIDLSPDFQRRDAWNPKNKSKFVESVILQLPIPQIVLAERKEQKGTYIVLDGKQRLLTLAQFAGGLSDEHPVMQESRSLPPLRLSGLKLLKSLNNKTYAEIMKSPDLKGMLTQFDNHTIRSALIRNWPDDDYLYEVFIRLNTGSAKLSTQELRQAMKPGGFTEFLSKRSSESVVIQKILNIDAPDFRMRDVDLLLRMIAFSTQLDNYNGNLKMFLDITHDELNKTWGQNKNAISGLVSEIEEALNFMLEEFGDSKYVGRRWRDGAFEAPVNRAVLDVQLGVVLSRHNRQLIKSAQIDLLGLFKQVSTEDRDFVEAITGTTKSIRAVLTRFNSWKNVLEHALNQPIEMPRLPNGG